MFNFKEFKENAKIYNDSENVWAEIDGMTVTLSIDEIINRFAFLLCKKEEYAFEASEIIENDEENGAWFLLYDKYCMKFDS